MTQTILYIQAQAVCAVLLAVLLGFIFHFEYGKQQRIKCIYICTLLAIVLDCLCVIFGAHPVPETVYTALVGCVGYLWLMHCLRRVQRALVKKVWFHILAFLPTVAMCVCSLVAGRAYGLSIGFIYVAVLWLWMGICVLRAQLKRHKKEYFLSAALTLPVTVCALVKLVWLPQGLSLFGFGVLMGLAFLFARTLYRKTRTDKLTKLSNLAGMEDEFYVQLAEYKRDENDLFYIISCDMDHFKQINDKHGHAVGNEALQLVADVMIRVSERYDARAFRVGGDEFVIILDTKDEEEVKRICEELRAGFEKAKEKQSAPYKLCMSVGYELFDGESDLEELLKRADSKLYEAKQNRE